MQNLETDTGSPSPYRDKENPIVSVHIPLMTRTAMSHNLEILVFEGNFVSCVQADASRNMSLAMAS